jgi:hypothetical protein
MPPRRSRGSIRATSGCRGLSTTARLGLELKSLVGSLGVVVVDVGVEHSIEMAGTEDHEPTDACASHTADPPFGGRVGFRCPPRCAHHLEALSLEYLVEGGAEAFVSPAD